MIAHHRCPRDPEGIEKRNEMTDGIFAEFRPYLIARQRNQVGLGFCNDGTDRIFCKCTLAYVMKISELNIGQIQHLKRLTLFFGNRYDIVVNGKCRNPNIRIRRPSDERKRHARGDSPADRKDSDDDN